MTMKPENTEEENTLHEEAGLEKIDGGPEAPVAEAPVIENADLSADELAFYQNDGFSDPIVDDNHPENQAETEMPSVEEPPAEPAPATPAAPVAAIAPPAQELSPQMSQYVQGLENQNRAAGDAADQQALKNAIVEYSGRLVQDQGMTPEQAMGVATNFLNLKFQQFQDQMRYVEQTAAAFEIGARHGADPQALMQLPSRAAMEEAAKGFRAETTSNARMQALENELKDIKKANIPASKYAAPAGVTRTRGSQADLRQRYADGGTITEAEAAALYG